MTPSDDPRWIAALLLITVATGMLDAVSLLHLGTFTGYMTGTVILIGVGLAQASRITLASVVALGTFLTGALIGGRLVRRPHPSPQLVGDVLIAVAVLVGIAALLRLGGMVLPVVAILALAMGLQTSATRHAGVADMSMPAATMALHGLVHDSRLAGGRGDRMGRRLGVLVGLIGGAALGAAISAWMVSAALAAVAVLLVAAAALLRWARLA